MKQENYNMDTMPLNKRHYRLLFIASLGQVTGAALATLIGIVIPMIQLLSNNGLSSIEQGLLACMSLFGISIGSFVCGKLSDEYGYLFFFRFCPALILVSSLFVYIVDTRLALFIGLFFMGLGIGGGYSLDSDYIVEVMPKKWRLFMVGVAKASSSIGNIISVCICFLFLIVYKNVSIWNSLFLIISGLAVLMLLLRINFAQGPHWLIAHGRESDALKAVHKLLGSNVSLGNVGEKTINRTKIKRVTLRRLFTKKNMSKIYFSTLSWACEGFSVYGIGVFLPILVISLHIESSEGSPMFHLRSSLELTIFISLFILFGFILGLFLFKKVYHVRLLYFGFFLSGIGLLALTLSYYFHWAIWISILAFMFFELCLNAGPHLITFIAPPRIYPIAERGTGTGLAASCGKIGAIIGVFFIPLLLQWGGIVLVMLTTMVVMFFGAYVSYRFGREVVPDDIDEEEFRRYKVF